MSDSDLRWRVFKLEAKALELQEAVKQLTAMAQYLAGLAEDMLKAVTDDGK